jgi:hypothetical protein
MGRLPPPAEFLEEKGYLTINQLVEYLKEHYPLKALSYPALRRQVGKTLHGEQAGGQLRITKDSILRYVGKGGASPLPTLPGPVDAPAPPTAIIGPGIQALIEENLKMRVPADEGDSPMAQPPRTLNIPEQPPAASKPRLVPISDDDDDNAA